MTDLRLRFENGRDVLSAYWGYLSDGGLVVPDSELEIGQEVAIDLQIASTQTRYALHGAVVRRDRGRQLVIRFQRGEPHEVLVGDALSETDNVPARRHRRLRVDRPARVACATAAAAARLLDVSDEGCCVDLEEAGVGSLEIGASVEIRWDDVRVTGRIVRSRHTERGVQIDPGSRTDQLRAFLDRASMEARHDTRPGR